MTRLLVLLLLQLGTACYGAQVQLASAHLREEIPLTCSLACPLQNDAEGDFDVGCGNECKIEQCTRGCMSWQQALASSCQNVCNGTQNLLPPKQLYCIMGCNDALNRYFQLRKDELGLLPAPALVADSLTATSLRLDWDGPRPANTSILVQWRIEEPSVVQAWHYCRNQTWSSSTVLVGSLTPYTKYRFRIALLMLPHHNEPVLSEPSVVISTLASGVPSSPPQIVRATAVDSSRISVSWKPGPFPNGPVLSYVLHISELPGGYSALKDIPASEQTGSYMFTNVESNRTYGLSIAMRNSVGPGPSVSVLVTTPTDQNVNKSNNVIQPVLILGAEHTVIRQPRDLADEPIVIYQTTNKIKGIAVHVSKRLLFVSDSKGYVLRTSVARYGAPTTILTRSHTSFMPLDLSIDWLNDQLYMLGEVAHSSGTRWQIARCSLEGRGLTIAVAGFLSRPHHIEVDPYNGYLFWVTRGTPKSGLYRLDLADISNGVKHEILPDLILEDQYLGAFTIDHTNFHLLIANKTQNTIMSVRIDGHEVFDFRNNTQQPMFQDVLSLARANGLFYWTNGDQIFSEEYHREQNSYFHFAFPGEGTRYIAVCVDLQSTQPLPIPVNPPTNVQAILGSDIARASWQAPHLLGGQGKGAWQNWSYQLHIEDEVRNITIFKQGINSTSCTIQNLVENTKYIIKTAAYTSAGKGPWSSEFKGKTLRVPEDGQYASIIWSAAEGLLKSDVTGENVETLIYKSNLKGSNGDYHIIDIAWYKDKLYLVSNTSHLYWYNITNHNTGQVKEIDSIGSIAVDWIGKKLYWSNPKQQLIMRGNLNGSQQEPLPILTVAKELNIDAEHAYIYWSTGHSVECARLNGEDRHSYYPAELFSGKQVMGLTLDMDLLSVYWIVRSFEGSKLFQAPMAINSISNSDTLEVKSSDLQYPNMQGPLCYFNDHLLWLQDDKNAVIGDLNGENAAIIRGLSLSGLNMVAVFDPALHHYPTIDCCDEINVIPDSINISSIEINGTWQEFSIEWDPVSNVNFGKVFYEVKVDDFTKTDFIHVLEEPRIIYKKYLAPYSSLVVLINAFTYWGTSPQVRKLLHSPPSIPSVPTNPRVFVMFERNPVRISKNIVALFRWDPPMYPNGVIKGYTIRSWLTLPDSANHTFSPVTVDPITREYKSYNLIKNATYYFQVEAYTDVGNGVATEPVKADADVETPVPKLLLSTGDAVKISDCDKHENKTLSRSGGPAVDMGFISHENKIFWLNEVQELYSSTLDGRNRIKILTLNGTGTSISVDWISRHIYWSEKDERILGSSIFSLDLNQVGRGIIQPKRVLRRPKLISKIDVLPLSSSLFWIEVNRNYVSNLMMSGIDGKSIQPFFSPIKKRRRRQNSVNDYCNCPENPIVGKAMAVDKSDSKTPKLFWVDGWQHHVLSSDIEGCICALVVNATANKKAGLPPTSITADHKFLYWSNTTEGRVYTTVKISDESLMNALPNSVTSIDILGVQQITALGSHLQPFPAPECLIPTQTSNKVKLIDHTDTSIKLELPKPERNPYCENISLATIEYTIYYGLITESTISSCRDNISLCLKLVTYNKFITISNLKPYSKYVFMIELRNYYSELQGVTHIIGPPKELKTAAGAPSPPQNVTVIVMNPTKVKVQWLPPRELNDLHVWYELHWRTEGMVAGVRPKKHPVLANRKNESTYFHSAELDALLAGHNYIIWVRAYSMSTSVYSESNSTEVTTFPEPENITLLERSAYHLNLSWCSTREVASFEILCYEATSEQLLNKAKYDNTEDEYVYTLENLRPKRRYMFKLALMYTTSEEPYIWPPDGRFSFETLGDRPGPPGIPTVNNLRRSVYRVMWTPSDNNGAQLELYSLESKISGARRDRRETNDTQKEENSTTEDWNTQYNGSDNYWIISDLSPSFRYIFRVRSKNMYGWSDYSEPSEPFDLTEAARLANEPDAGLVLGISIPVGVSVLCMALLVIIVFVLRRRIKDKKSLQAVAFSNTGRLDVELATLRELPRRGNFIHNTNALYTANDIPSEEDLALLPHIRRDQITLTKFLGSGAFGEVFEGNARNLANSGGIVTRVAIKTLRKGASEEEKTEFLKEAQLMSNFKHDHILQLLGVCLDNDPNFIIMELMENGDLLSYLRSSRPHIYSSNALTLFDLISMCVDVAKGCRYLEEMHFVHRDLACRNCLVSSGDPQTRIVKIGDFGLARDIYKNDYYRKEGEGLLPVRWMAPESLVDGVFTTQSDVWAFGVLTWEIMTFGQQPYPARTNLEVLHYVRNGGRLGRPNNCPEELHELMQKTWNYNAESRPTFKYCLEVLEELKTRIRDVPIISQPNGHYITQVQNGSSWKTMSEEDIRDQMPFLTAAGDEQRAVTRNESNHIGNGYGVNGMPKYLELICESTPLPPITLNVSDGYEVPRAAPMTAGITTKILEDISRTRTFSTSSTVSDSSSSMLAPCQRAPPVSETNDHSASPGTDSTSDITTDESLNELQKITSSQCNKQNGEKELNSLEHLLPVVNDFNKLLANCKSKLENRTKSNMCHESNMKFPKCYTNVVKEPVPEEEDSKICNKICNGNTLTSVSEKVYTITDQKVTPN